MAKLVAIGDSITQGVMSGAISRPEYSYPALIAEAMGLEVWMPDGQNEEPSHQNVFRVPYFPGIGLPLNIEELFEAIGPDFDSCIDAKELRGRLLFFSKFIDHFRDSYRLSEVNYDGIYHNLAVLSFQVFHSFTINSACYKELVEKNQKDIDKQLRRWKRRLSIIIGASYMSPRIVLGLVKWINNRKLKKMLTKSTSVLARARSLIELYLERFADVDSDPSATMYRIAQHVLNPSQSPARNGWTQICNLKHIRDKEGVENLILFLGANDCLGTVRDLEIRDMTGNCVLDDLEERGQYNLTSEDVFRRDYERMVRQISEVISKDTNVFVGNIPHVTIPPITQASNEIAFEHNERTYFTRYAPFFANREEDRLFEDLTHLAGDDARRIDDHIDALNNTIDCIIHTVPRNGNWHLVDICSLLEGLAVRRTGNDSNPHHPLECFLLSDPNLPDTGHELLNSGLDPLPNVRRFQTNDENERIDGGIFSLDCFHPTTIGQGLIAEAFVRAMKEAEVRHVTSNRLDWRLDWGDIIENDTLIQDPPVLWNEFINITEEHSNLANIIYRIFA